MKTIPTTHPGISRAMLGALLFVTSFIVIRFIADAPPPYPDSPAIDLEGGKQLDLPFPEKDLFPDGVPEPTSPEQLPLVKNKRYDEDRLGTCIIYGLIAPRTGEYLIPGCYGKPDHWEFVEKGTVLKIGRHWNSKVENCTFTTKLVDILRNKRYISDKKFPKGFITIRENDVEIKFGMNFQILDCVEKVTERACEELEKQFIFGHGGAKKLLLNCCCR